MAKASQIGGWLLLLVLALCMLVSAQQSMNGGVARRSAAAPDDDEEYDDAIAGAGDGKPNNAGAAAAAAAAAKAAGVLKKRQKKNPVVNQVVDFAPAANVTWGDDIDDEGKCTKEIEQYCDDVEEGEGQLADCMSDMITQAENPDNYDDPPEVSDDCRDEVYQFKITRNSNINKNIPLARACKADADKFCNVTWFFGYKSGQVISCLRDVKNQVSKPCKMQLFKIMLDAAVDIRADPMLYEACRDDSENLCKGTKPGGGRVQACLRDKRMQLSWACEEQLFRQEMENAEDIRLSVRLFGKCMPDKRKFCKDVEPGNARAKECLEEHRDELSGGCRDEIDAMIERRVRDFRLDSKLRTACEDEIFNMCAYFGDLDDIDTYDSSVINCLQDYQNEIKKGECKRQVKKYVSLASQDIRFDVPLAEACYDDRQKYCANVPPGSARVIRCLSNQRKNLSPVCRATLFDEEVRFSENIDFQYPMKAACTREIDKFCHGIPHGNARVIRCLQDNKGEKDFGKACRDEVNAYEEEIGKDYRLNFRLNKACKADVQALCPTVCQMDTASGTPDQVCGGKVLRCLTDSIDEIKDESCKKEVYYFEKMEVSNFRNDIILAEACRNDVEQFCATVEAGEGRVHKCLRDNRKKLSDTCRKEELLLEEKENDSIELSVSLLKACRAERQLYCKGVAPGQARVFRCLAENMNDPDFGNTCKFQIIYKLQRRQANWKLDPPLRKACKGDVNKYCSSENSKDSEDGLVYKCMIQTYGDLSSGCQKEMGRAVHMALYVWQEGAIITQDCDEDIKKYCLAVRPNMASRPGAVGSCLASILERQEAASSKDDRRRSMLADDNDAESNDGGDAEAEEDDEEKEVSGGSKRAFKRPANVLAGAKLSDKCYTLSDIAEPPNMKKAFESSLSFAALKDQLDRVGSSTGLPLTTRDRRGNAQGISLTGWVATLGMAAMVVLIAYGAWTGYKRFRGQGDGQYTLVVKQQYK